MLESWANKIGASLIGQDIIQACITSVICPPYARCPGYVSAELFERIVQINPVKSLECTQELDLENRTRCCVRVGENMLAGILQKWVRSPELRKFLSRRQVVILIKYGRSDMFRIDVATLFECFMAIAAAISM